MASQDISEPETKTRANNSKNNAFKIEDRYKECKRSSTQNTGLWGNFEKKDVNICAFQRAKAVEILNPENEW